MSNDVLHREHIQQLHKFKKGRHKGIELFMNSALVLFLFVYCWNLDSFALHEMRPLKR